MPLMADTRNTWVTPLPLITVLLVLAPLTVMFAPSDKALANTMEPAGTLITCVPPRKFAVSIAARNVQTLPAVAQIPSKVAASGASPKSFTVKVAACSDVDSAISAISAKQRPTKSRNEEKIGRLKVMGSCFLRRVVLEGCRS